MRAIAVAHMPEERQRDRQQDAYFDADRDDCHRGDDGKIKLAGAFARRMSRRPLKSIIPIAIVKTIAANTQRGRYWSGPVKNNSTSSTTAAKTNCAS